MDTTKRNKMMLRWSVATATVIAVFWGIWYLINGSVPVVHEIKMAKDWVIVLPFGISRFWDVLIGPVYSTAIILLFTNKSVKKDEDLVAGLAFGLAFGLVVGLAFGLAFGLVAGLIVGLIVGLAFGLIVGLAFGLVAGLAFGLIVGLAFGLIVGLVAGLIVGLKYLIKNLAPVGRSVSSWLMAR